MVCETCAGTRICGPCDGRGEFGDVDAGAVFGCEVCDGDGVCVECGGVGEIEEPEPGPDPIGIDEFDDMEVGE